MGSCMSADHTSSRRRAAVHPQSSTRSAQKLSAKRVQHRRSRKDRLEDSFILGRVIGRGHYGVVRTAMHVDTRQVFACKTIDKRRLSAARLLSVHREAAILHFLSPHSSIASLVDEFEDAQSVHLIMELCPGGTLFDEVTTASSAAGNGKIVLSEADAAERLSQVAKDIAYMHSRGVMHRDIKLENIMFADPEDTAKSIGSCDSGDSSIHRGIPSSSSTSSISSTCSSVESFSLNRKIKLVDFGLAINVEEGERFKELVGSAYYVAPEVLKKDYGAECDVWSMGVLLYMMLSGRPPFWAPSEDGVCAAVLKGEYDLQSGLWRDVSDEAKHLLRRMMEVDPKKRITAAEILEHPWVRRHTAAQ